MPTWIYILDTFKPVDIDVGEIVRLAEEDPLELFNRYVKDAIEEELKGLDRVELYNIYFNPKGFELVIEYIVKCGLGEVSVKLIHSSKPMVTIQKYYEFEKRRE